MAGNRPTEGNAKSVLPHAPSLPPFECWPSEKRQVPAEIIAAKYTDIDYLPYG